MNNFLLSIAFFLFLSVSLLAQEKTTHKAEVIAFQNELIEAYSNPATSPLKKMELTNFEGLRFFPFNEKMKVNARYKPLKKAKKLEMNTKTGRKSEYEKVAKVVFKINGKKHELFVYQSERLKADPEYTDYLFLPFTDQTSGESTYGGGRYLDLHLPEGRFLEIDFNQSYHPYCAYTDGYSCPIPPRENHLKMDMKAGIQF